MTGLHILHADNGKDVPGLGAVDLVAIISMHFHHAPDAFGFAGEGVEYRVALVDLA